MKETYFEVYYDQIEEFTFKSVILPLSIEEIQAIHDAHAALETSVRLNLGYFLRLNLSYLKYLMLKWAKMHFWNHKFQ